MIKSIIKKFIFAIGLISSLMTIDSWVESKSSKQQPNIKYEYNYYMNNTGSTENKITYYKK